MSMDVEYPFSFVNFKWARILLVSTCVYIIIINLKQYLPGFYFIVIGLIPNIEPGINSKMFIFRC